MLSALSRHGRPTPGIAALGCRWYAAISSRDQISEGHVDVVDMQNAANTNKFIRCASKISNSWNRDMMGASGH